MVYNTALSFLLGGMGLLFLATGRRRPAIPCGAVVAGLGLLGLIQHLFGRDLGIDQLLMTHYVTVATPHPGRMAPNTTVCFLVVGVAILLMSRPVRPGWRPLVVGLSGSVVVGLGTIAVIGYLVGMRTYGWGQFLPMAVHTAAGMIFLGVGVTALAWRDSDLEAIGTPRWLPIPVGVSIVAATLCLWQPLVARARPGRSVDQGERGERTQRDPDPDGSAHRVPGPAGSALGDARNAPPGRVGSRCGVDPPGLS